MNENTAVIEIYADYRPGYELIDVVDGCIPFYVVSGPAIIQRKKKVTPIDEFVLRAISVGVNTTETIGFFLGLEQDVLEQALSRLWKDDVLDNPSVEGQRIFKLTEQGELMLTELMELIPESRDIWFPFDRITYKPSLRHPRLLSRKSDLIKDDASPLFIKPRTNSKPKIEDLEIRNIDESIKATVGSSGEEADVLLFKRIDRVEEKYLECQILLYESTDLDERVFEIAIDGRVDTKLAAEIEGLGGLDYLDLQFGGLDPVDVAPVEQFEQQLLSVGEKIVSVKEVGELRRTFLNVSENSEDDTQSGIRELKSVTGSLVAKSEIEIRNLDTFEHRPLMFSAISEAKERLMIIAPWITRASVNKQFLQALRSALRRGVVVHIGYGFQEDDLKNSPAAINDLEKMAEEFKNFRIANLAKNHLGSTHAKILIWDNNQVVSSFNWLSFLGDAKRTYRHENGILVRDRAQLVDPMWLENKNWIERMAVPN